VDVRASGKNRTTDAQHPPNVRVLFYNLSPTGVEMMLDWLKDNRSEKTFKTLIIVFAGW